MTSDYTLLDHPMVLQYLFHPRPDTGTRRQSDGRHDMMIPVEKTVQVGASFHFADPHAPTVLFFHGNGEIVSDYDDLGRLFVQHQMNLFVVDYRGYGSSSGRPSVSAMMQDSVKILDFVLAYRQAEKHSGTLCVMGRSLGSASALELAAQRPEDFDCLVIESGFAKAEPLLQTLGAVLPEAAGNLSYGRENIDKIRLFLKPLLVIHAQYDHIIPFADGQALFDACPSADKTLLEIKGANHNDIFLRGMDLYLAHLQTICGKKDVIP